MDDELFETLYQIAWQLWAAREKRVHYAGRTIVLLYMWSVIRSKPGEWVCDPRNLPRLLDGYAVPSRSQFDRRLKTPQVQAMLLELETHLRHVPQAKMLGCWLLDAKPLVVSPYSKDKSAKWGWAYDGKARGYKVFAMSDLSGHVVAWQTKPMNEAEPLVARKLIECTDRPGYVIGDSIYDSGPLHELTAWRDLQLIAPRKMPGGNIGVRAQQPTRLHAIAMLERRHSPMPLALRCMLIGRPSSVPSPSLPAAGSGWIVCHRLFELQSVSGCGYKAKSSFTLCRRIRTCDNDAHSCLRERSARRAGLGTAKPGEGAA